MRVLQIIFESMNWDDSSEVPGLYRHRLDTWPATDSHSAARCLGTGRLQRIDNGAPLKWSLPWPTIYAAGWQRGFLEGNVFPGQHVTGYADGAEPNRGWRAFIESLRKHRLGDYAIYWTLRGHVAIRQSCGFFCVPDDLRPDFDGMMDHVRNDVIPELPEDCLLLVHNDHGTARRNKPWESAMFDGFLFANQVIGEGWDYMKLHSLIKERLCAG